MRGSGADLDSFSNQLREHFSALGRNATGRRVTGAAAAALGLDPRRCYRQVVVVVVGMGNVNATVVAQEVHVNALRRGFPELDEHLLHS